MSEYIDYCEKCGLVIKCVVNQNAKIILTAEDSAAWHFILLDKFPPECNGIIIHTVVE